jgi:hypothetical protein
MVLFSLTIFFGVLISYILLQFLICILRYLSIGNLWTPNQYIISYFK